MNNKYNDLFDTLIKAYYDDTFDETLNMIITCHKISPQETFSIITSLCGVHVDFDNNYLHNLKKAISSYTVNKRIVEKLDCCNSQCTADKNHKYSCQKACPFNAIKYSKEKQSTIIEDDNCINCGLCVDACKHGRILDKVEFIPVINMIKENKTVIAAVAPSIMGQFGPDVTMDQLRAAFIKLGFSDMIEVAFAADILSIKESVEFNKYVKNKDDLMLTSCCCPMWVGLIRKVYNELIPHLSPSVSPMIAAGKIIKYLDPDAKVVFIGPCIAKKAEAKEADLKGIIDFVLTYQETYEIFDALDIKPSELKEVPTKEYTSAGGRSYGRTGGVTMAISDIIKDIYPEKSKYFIATQGNGIKECKAILNKALNGELKATFIEGMGCVGGCVGGPKAIVPIERGTDALNDFAKSAAIKEPLHSEFINSTLRDLGINSLKDFEDKDKTNIFEREF